MRKYCSKCGKEEEVIEIPRENTIHSAELRCPKNHFLGWKPKNKKKRRKPMNSNSLRKRIREFHKFDEEFCFLCNRTKKQLNKKETLSVDHILPLEFGGKDCIENMQILCSACHFLKNWLVTYLNKHLEKENE